MKMAKEFIWLGKTEEDMKKLTLKEYMDLAPSRVRRALKRGLTEAQKRLMKRVEAGDKNIETHCRDMVIIPLMIGLTIKVYNGKDFFPVAITGELVGHYLGEFSHTRKSVSHSAAGVGAAAGA
ncbi:MAG: ribosomal protein S19 family protein, partial [Nanoarchaeota archaeon]